MKTLGQLTTDFCNQTGGTTETEITQAKMFIGDSINYVLSCYDWDRTEVTVTNIVPLRAGVERYDLPFNFKKMDGVRLLAVTGYPYTRVGYFIDENRTGISIFPTPPGDGDWLEYTYAARQKTLTLSDYTTGNVISVENGSQTVLGLGTVWSQQMVGSYIKLGEAWDVGGDGEFYQIQAVNSPTSLTLTRPYQGNSTNASMTYLIGQIPVMNPDFHEMVNFKALQMYMIKNRDFKAADRYGEEFETRLERMKDYEASKTTSYVVENSGIFRNF